MSADDLLRNDLYALLDIPVTATQHEIRKQFRKLSRVYHPDKNTSLAAAELEIVSKKYELLSFAYSILTDPILRKEYDQLYFIEKQIKGHGKLKESFDDYIARDHSERSDADLQKEFLEKQQAFVNGTGFANLSTKSIAELATDMQSARDAMLDPTLSEPKYRVKGVDDINKTITKIRKSSSSTTDIVVGSEPMPAMESNNLATASIHSSMFGSPFADASGEDTGQWGTYGDLRQATLLPISQSSIDSYSVAKNYKHETEMYEQISQSLPNLIAQSDPHTTNRAKHSAILQNILNM